MKIIHLPYSKRNPYQKLLGEELRKKGVDIKGTNISHLWDVSFLNVSIFSVMMKYWKPDIIHLHWQSSFLSVEGSRLKSKIKAYIFILQLWVAKALRIKIVWTAHNLKRHEKTYRDIESQFTRKLAKHADKIIAHCKTAKNEIQWNLDVQRGDRIFIVPHGNFIDYYPNTISQKNARDKLNIEPAKLTFLFLGEIRYYKGVIELVDTFKSLNDQDAQLLIAGRPHDEAIYNEIEERVKGIKNIKIDYAYIPDNDMQDYIKACDIMVFPYRNIFTSGGILLALSFGKPIIAPRIGCIVDTLGNSSNYLYDPRVENGLLSAMKESIADVNQLDMVGNGNLVLAEIYHWRSIAEKTLQIYHACLNN